MKKKITFLVPLIAILLIASNIKAKSSPNTTAKATTTLIAKTTPSTADAGPPLAVLTTVNVCSANDDNCAMLTANPATLLPVTRTGTMGISTSPPNTTGNIESDAAGMNNGNNNSAVFKDVGKSDVSLATGLTGWGVTITPPDINTATAMNKAASKSDPVFKDVGNTGITLCATSGGPTISPHNNVNNTVNSTAGITNDPNLKITASSCAHCPSGYMHPLIC